MRLLKEGKKAKMPYVCAPTVLGENIPFLPSDHAVYPLRERQLSVNDCYRQPHLSFLDRPQAAAPLCLLPVPPSTRATASRKVQAPTAACSAPTAMGLAAPLSSASSPSRARSMPSGSATCPPAVCARFCARVREIAGHLFTCSCSLFSSCYHYFHSILHRLNVVGWLLRAAAFTNLCV